MDYCYNPRTFFCFAKGGFRHSTQLSKIKFHFFFQIEYQNFYINHDSTLQGFLDCFPASEDYASAAVPVDESLSFVDIAEAIGGAIGNRIPAVDGRCEDLIELVWEHVCESLRDETLPMYGVLDLTFNVSVEHRHVYVVKGECPFTIPAAELPSFALLEKYEVDVVGDGERCCCICLEELGDGGGRRGGALRTPCSHVFHGDCIKKWLRKSPCCPLCRCQMTTIE